MKTRTIVEDFTEVAREHIDAAFGVFEQWHSEYAQQWYKVFHAHRFKYVCRFDRDFDAYRCATCDEPREFPRQQSSPLFARVRALFARKRMVL